MEMGVVLAGTRFMHGIAFVGTGELSVQAFQWLQNGPHLAKAVCIIARLRNELVSYKDEESGNATYPCSCYKREYNASDEETVPEFQRRIADTWKIVDEELMSESAKAPLEILTRVINYGRLMEACYKDGDGITDGKSIENCIQRLYIDPIPL